MSDQDREILEVDVLFVGAGPANLAAAYRLAQLVQEHNARGEDGIEPMIVMIEKSADIGDHVLSGAVFLFAYSTMISWSYYGQQCWEHLFGQRTKILFKGLFLICVFVGAVVNLGSVLAFTDVMILCMAFPNVAGMYDTQHECLLLARH